MKSFRLALITLAAFIAGSAAAFAVPASTLVTMDLRSGPGLNFPISAQMYAQKTVDAQCQSDGWCHITGGGIAGWTTIDTLAIRDVTRPRPQPQPQPQPPRPQPQPQPWPWPPQPQPQPWPQPQPQPPRPRPPVYQPAEACFYSERNFGGSSFCLEVGESLNSFRTWDNRIRSVEISGRATVDLCSDRNFYGNCVTIRSNTARLPSQLDRRASSVEVY